jgi:hypothetical protein
MEWRNMTVPNPRSRRDDGWYPTSRLRRWRIERFVGIRGSAQCGASSYCHHHPGAALHAGTACTARDDRRNPVLVLGEGRFGASARPRALRLMPSPPNLTVPAPPSPRPGSTADPAPPDQQRAAHWLRRADLFLRVIVRLYIGFILVFLPWTHVWAFNRFFVYYAPVSHLMESGAVRGVVSGLGLLNLWIAISEAFHYKES